MDEIIESILLDDWPGGLHCWNKGFILFEELLETRFQDSSNTIELVINKKMQILCLEIRV